MSLTRQLGGASKVVFRKGGYGAIRTPLLSSNASRYLADDEKLCFQTTGATSVHKRGANCITEPGRNPENGVSLAALTPYSFLAVQAKSNLLPHSEIDFATIVWTAWGERLLSEHGYGTIATVDRRRLDQADNNPTGHNTLIIRQASPYFDPELLSVRQMSGWGTKEEVTFSQFTGETGEIGEVDAGVFGRSCIALDGARVYGSTRSSGWFDTMHRYACPLPGGHFLLIDSFSVKANRSPLKINKVKSTYDGPTFDETSMPGSSKSLSNAYQYLDVDSYFHSDVGVKENGALFDPETDSNHGHCSHVDINVTWTSHNNTSSKAPSGKDIVFLEPRCGMGRYKDAQYVLRPRKPNGVAAFAVGVVFCPLAVGTEVDIRACSIPVRVELGAMVVGNGAGARVSRVCSVTVWVELGTMVVGNGAGAGECGRATNLVRSGAVP